MTEFTAIRAVGETDDAWEYEGLAIPYGGPYAGQDLTGTHFTKSTDLCEDWFPQGGRPILYAHGFDATLKTAVVGRDSGVVREDDKGRWIKFQIDKAREYGAEIKQLVDEGVLALSSAAVDHLVSIAAKSGEITRWPWVETSLVPNPANPEALIRTVKSADAVAHLAVVGASVKELEIEVTEAAPEGEAEDYAAETEDPAEHAKAGTHILACLADLVGEESDEPEQVAILNRAVAAVQEWITAEIAEIGSGDEAAEGDDTTDASAAPGPADDGTGKATEIPPAPVLAVKAGGDAEPEPGPDLDAIRRQMTELAVATARALLR